VDHLLEVALALQPDLALYQLVPNPMVRLYNQQHVLHFMD
jgi:hypothetical protein